MKALTLHQPWAAAIAHSCKRIENRSWKPPAKIIGERIAIHAGAKEISNRVYMEMRQNSLFRDILIHVDVRSHIVCTAVVKGICASEADLRLLTYTEHEQWYSRGSYGWILGDVRTLRDPIPCSGFQGLWEVPAEIVPRLLWK